MKAILLGSGNVATHLGKALHAAGHTVLQIWSRNQQNAEALATQFDSTGINSFDALSPEADVYFISVPDKAISGIIAQFPFRDKLLVHTSGTTGLDILKEASCKTGVFYPVQTFSKQRELDFKIIPIAIEGNDAEAEEILLGLAGTLSDKVVVFDSEKRKALHVAAVFACNFSNHLYTIAETILLKNQLDFNLIRPLIAETAAKIQSFSPQKVQTGPAIRRDQSTIHQHISFLEKDADLQKLYHTISQNIINFYEKD